MRGPAYFQLNHCRFIGPSLRVDVGFFTQSQLFLASSDMILYVSNIPFHNTYQYSFMVVRCVVFTNLPFHHQSILPLSSTPTSLHNMHSGSFSQFLARCPFFHTIFFDQIYRIYCARSIFWRPQDDRSDLDFANFQQLVHPNSRYERPGTPFACRRILFINYLLSPHSRLEFEFTAIMLFICQGRKVPATP